MRRVRRSALALLVALGLGSFAVAAVPLADRGPGRRLNEAWFAWRVRGDVEAAHGALTLLASDAAVGSNWRERASGLLEELEVERVTPAPPEDPVEEPVLEPDAEPGPDPRPVDRAPVAPPVPTPDPETDVTQAGEASRSESDGPEVWQLRAPDPAELPAMPHAGDEVERQVAALDARVAAWERANAPWLVRTDDRATAGFAGLLGRWYARDEGASKSRAYELCTMSFDHGVRDDPDRRITYNDWDLSYGNGTDDLDVTMTGGDRSTIEPLDGPEAGTVAEEVHAAYGRSYLVHVLDKNTDRWFEFRIVEQVSGAWILIAWLEVEAP